jgi:hypothetical protein
MTQERAGQRGVFGEVVRHSPWRSRGLIIAACVIGLLCLISTRAQADSQPTSFEFRFRGPAPGMRFWRREGQQWTETYASGQKGIFRVKTAPFRLHGVTGALVQKVDEKDFFVFIPDLHAAKMEVWTYKGKGPWLFLAKMGDVGPKDF